MQNLQLKKTNSKLNSMHGKLNLHFKKRGSLTRLTSSHHSSPLKASKALYLDGEGTATVYLMETSGGMVAGDWNAYTFLVEDDCDVTLIPQSSTKVYPSKFDFACRQTIEMTVGANARVKWLPETTIPFENSIFLADTKIHLQENSSLVFGEIFSSGRQKSAESFEFRRFSSKTNIYVNDQIIVFDHLDINKEASPLFELGMFEEHTYMGSIWLIDQSLASREWEFPFFKSASHRFGMTQLDDYGVHFRWLTNDLCLLKEQMEQVISEV